MEKKKKTTKKEITVKKVKKIQTKNAKVKKVTSIKKPIKTISEKEKKVEEKPKFEKWYVWLRKNILESEKNISKKSRYRRAFVSLFAFTCFIVVAYSTAIIDYSTASVENKAPSFAVIKHDKFKQVTIYYGAFYKAWKCDYGNPEVIYGRYRNEISECEIVIHYDENGYYKNPNKVKISNTDMNNIKPYYNEEFNYFETEEELNNAVTISTAINEVWWVKTKSKTVLNNDSSIEIAIFSGLDTINGVSKWNLKYTNTAYHRCVKQDNNVYLFSSYDSNKETCGTEWLPLKISQSVCDLVEDSKNNYVKDLVEITKLCD